MRAEADTRWAASARSVLEVFALRACDQPEEKDMEALLERVAELEQRLFELEKNGVAVRAASAPEEKKPAQPAGPVPRPIVETPAPAGGRPPKDVWNDTLKYMKKAEPAIYGPCPGPSTAGIRMARSRPCSPPGKRFL